MPKRSESDGRGKALDLWQAPEGAGEPRFCVATTFTFHADFFEIECLGRFLQMETHPQETESVGYLIEREEKLAGARVCVLADRRHATAKESLRWDVLPVVVPHAIQHAKLTLLGWSNHVRVIIGSGNLTEPGYRKNVEVFGCLETARDEAGDHAGILESIRFLERVADHALGDEAKPPKKRLRETLQAARAMLEGWPHQEHHRGRIAPVFGGMGRSILDQMRDHWPSGGPPRYVHVMSPFFDADPQVAGVMAALADGLAKRGERVVHFYVSADDHPDGKTRLFAPPSLLGAAREQAETIFHKLPPKQDDEVRPLPLHAKMLALVNDIWQLLLIGSSNFTRAGLGLNTGAANLEANLTYLTRMDEPDFQALESIWPEVADEVELDSPNLVWDSAFDEDGAGTAPPPLPAAFREALFEAGTTSRLLLSLSDGLPLRWEICTTEGTSILRSDSWTGQSSEVSLPWIGLPPLLLRVTWGAENHVADWPVNVVDFQMLPPPAALRDLTLEELLEVLASTRPLYKVVVEMVGRRKNRGMTSGEIDPHKRVNTATFLLQRTRRLAQALERLRARLERPVGSVEALDWRLDGPIGPRALADALQKDARSPDEARFFLAELALALKRVRVEETARGGVDSKVVRDKIAIQITDLESRVAAGHRGHKSAMDRYITTAFAEARKH